MTSKSYDPHARTGRGAATPAQRQGSRGPSADGQDRAALEREAERNASQIAAAPLPAASSNVAASGELDPTLRHAMETRLGHDFSRVKVHVGADAARSAAALDAAAFTVGTDVVFNGGRFAPETQEGQQLLAHELSHVAQQQQMASPVVQRQPLSGGSAAGDGGEMLWESYRQSVTVDDFDSDQATLRPQHITQLDDYKKRLQVLLGLYPESFFNIIGHTDAADSTQHNQELGQRRADAVRGYLASGDNAVPANLLTASSLGESSLAVETPGREARNRRVEIIPTLRKRNFTFPPFTPSVPLPGPAAGAGKGSSVPGIAPQPGPPLGGLRTPIPPQQPGNWWEDALKRDPLLRELPEWIRSKVLDALKDGDESLAEKAIDALPLDDKTKAAVQAIAKSLLQLAKGKQFKIPPSPPRGPEQGPMTPFPQSPGQTIIPGPKWEF